MIPRQPRTFALIALVVIAAEATVLGEPRFRDTVGPFTVGEVRGTAPLTACYLTWGGDMATFYANGGLQTQPDSLFAKAGLNIQLKPGDDFIRATRDYMEGRTPFLRGTFRMIGMASEVIGSDPRTKPYIFLQMTWSAGDHCVARADVRTIADLKGRKIVLQKGGPHVGMLDDILETARLGWGDVAVVWADDLTGTPKSPAEMFRRDPAIAACFVISPDMTGLTGGLHKTGSGAEGTVKGARILVSTAELSYSIADVYAVRKDFYDAHPDVVQKFAAGYLKAQEEITDLKKAYEKGGSDEYMRLLRLTQQIYGNQTIPTLDDAHGLLSDCTFVGYPGNVAFFMKKNNPHGFEVFQEKSLRLATSRGYAGVRQGFFPSPLDWGSPAFVDYLTKTGLAKGERFRAEAVAEEIEALTVGGALDERTILTFAINFEPNQDVFSEVQYGTEYNRVIDALGKFGNAVIVVRGHTDPTLVLKELINAGKAKGILQQTGTSGDYRYSFRGRPLRLEDTAEIVRLIEAGEFDGVAGCNPRETMQACLNLSRNRAEAVRKSILKFAGTKNLELDQSQIQPMGVGIREPFIAKPSNMAEAKQNMRVEFRILRVTAEVMKPSDFDF